MATGTTVGSMLRDWRQRRRLSQLELALETGVSTRHLSFVETGRSRPSAEMVLALASQLEVPLRERNQLLLAAGYAPRYAARSLDGDPELARVRDALGRVLAGHEPYPAFAIDGGWNLVMSNSALGPLLEGVAAPLLTPPVNVARVALHPDGMAPRIVNLGEWRAHLLARLRRQIEVSADVKLAELLKELSAYPAPAHAAEPTGSAVAFAVPFRLATDAGVLSFISTTTVFGTPVDVTLSELALESFFPADPATAATLRTLAQQ